MDDADIDTAGSQRYRAIFESATDFAIVATDRAGAVTDWNPGAESIFGWTAKEMRGESIERFFTPEDRAHRVPAAEMARALESGRANDERWHLKKDGSRFWAGGEMMPLRDDAGTHLGFLKILRDQTAQRHAAEALRGAQGLNTLIFNSSRDCIVVLDLDGHTQFVSPGGIESMEISDVVAILGLSWVRVWKGADHDAAQAAVAEARAGRMGRFQGFCPTLKGTAKWWDVAISPLPGADGRPERLVSVGRDITNMKLAEQRLAASEAQFRSFAQAMPNHVWTAPPDGQLDWFNDRVYEYSGAAHGELDGQGWVGIVHPDDVPAAGERWAAALSSGQAYQTEFRLRRADGQYRWHIARAVPIRGADGAITRWIGTNTDIAEQKTTAEALAHLNEFLEREVAERTADRNRIWQLSTDLMLVAQFGGAISAVNPAWTSLLGWSEAELVGSNLLGVVHPDDIERTVASAEQLLRGEVVHRFENRYRHKDGSYRWINWAAVMGDGVVNAVGRDCTADKAQAEALRKTEAQLRQSQKMEAVGQLTGGVAHDFNNILQVISGNLQLIAKAADGNDKIGRRVLNAQAAVTRGAQLSSQLLAFSRRQALEPKVINVGRLVAGMDDMLRRALGESVEVETSVTGGLWNTFVDPAQIENALLNLAINARDAMGGNGKLTIEVGNAFLDDAYAQAHTDVSAGQYVLVAVSDTGSGMTPQVIAQAFEPFFSTKPVGQGTGLGLSMVYGLARQSGGHIKIYSELGQGTTVKLYLPRSHQGEDAVAIADAEPIEGGTETILVAEDDEAVRGTVVEMLGELGYRVLRAGDAAAALSIVDSGIRIDMLFTDVVMPGPLKSPELARKVRERQPNIAVLFTSGYTENAIVHGGRLDAGVDLLPKPYTRETLARKIRQVLGRGASRSVNRT
jgi:PAS domain S-box-containing protein